MRNRLRLGKIFTAEGEKTPLLTDELKPDCSFSVGEYLDCVRDEPIAATVSSQAIGHRGGQFLHVLDSWVLVVDWALNMRIEFNQRSLSLIAPSGEVLRHAVGRVVHCFALFDCDTDFLERIRVEITSGNVMIICFPFTTVVSAAFLEVLVLHILGH